MFSFLLVNDLGRHCCKKFSRELLLPCCKCSFFGGTDAVSILVLEPAMTSDCRNPHNLTTFEDMSCFLLCCWMSLGDKSRVNPVGKGHGIFKTLRWHCRHKKTSKDCYRNKKAKKILPWVRVPKLIPIWSSQMSDITDINVAPATVRLHC